MATTKKTSSKAKTKTTKQAVKSTKKTVSAKTAKTIKAKAVVSKAKPAKKATPVTLQTLRSLHTIAAGLFALLALAAGYLMNSTTYQLTLGHLAKDELASTAGTVLAPAVQVIYDVELRWLVVSVLLLSAVLPVLYITKLQNRYANLVTNTRMQPLRWVDYAVTGGLIMSVVALLSGVSDIPTLKLISGLVVTTAILSLISERQNNATNRPVKSAYYTSLFTGLLPWALVAAYAVATVVYGAGQVEWYVYALYAAVLGGFALQARNQHMEFRGANYIIVERNYIVISALTKVAFAAILIAGLYR